MPNVHEVWMVVSLVVQDYTEIFSFPFFFALDYLFKFLVIGNAGVGKSCLLHQFIEHKCEWFRVYFY